MPPKVKARRYSMSQIVPVLKDEHRQQPIPSAWRAAFCDIVESLKQDHYDVERRITNVRPISEKTAAKIANNVKAYSVRLASLPEGTWQTSVCQWMRGYWDVLIDLYSIEEGASDLVLDARVYEEGGGYVIDVHMVYVP